MDKQPAERFLWLRHAFVGRDSTAAPGSLETEWVGLFREMQPDGRVSYGVEHLDVNFNEVCRDQSFPTEREAEAHATAEYGLSPDDWREGQAHRPLP